MSIPNRADVLTKIYRSLKKHYSNPTPVAGRTVLEELLFACLLEDNRHEAAEKSFAALVDGFFDWNEIRVSSVKELAEVLGGLHDPETSARRLKKSLHGVFESTYQFDIEDMKKQNIGAAEKRLEKFPGTTRFVVAYVVQQALAGHSIPLDKGSLAALYVLGAATEKEVASKKVPGLERAISKKNGAEFGSLLHQVGVEITASPYSPKTRKSLLDLDPTCKDRLPKRPAKPKKEEPKKEAPKKKAAAKKAPAKAPKKAAAKKAPAKKAAAK
ncbi:MAG: hypothetical protein MI757_15615, partial [Pirellulales bacterium]|nr:hypothetical protein [Pirellulales bacterium]